MPREKWNPEHVEIRKVGHMGASLVAVIPNPIAQWLGWNRKDRLAWRVDGKVAVLEKVDLSEVAKLRAKLTVNSIVYEEPSDTEPRDHQ